MNTRISSVKEYFETLPQRFVAPASKGLHAIFQYELSGNGGGTYHAKVNDGTLEVVEGASEEPTVTAKLNADSFVKMANGELSPVMAYMKGQMKITGNVMLAQKWLVTFPAL